MKSVLYEFKKYKKINGTLFYCFEYYSFLRQRDPSIKFVIFRISESDFERVLEVFRERYSVSNEVFENIIRVRSVKALHDLSFSKNLIMDMKTFDSLYMFLRGDILCFANEKHDFKRSEHKKIVYYGYYDYQDYDVQTMLKLNFDIFRPARGGKDQLLVSTVTSNFDAALIPDALKGKKIIRKSLLDHYDNFFDQFDTLFYIHTGHDTNNRLIPECYYYGKEVVVAYTGLPKDSVYYRHEDIKKNGLASYRLIENDPMIVDFLEAS